MKNRLFYIIAGCVILACLGGLFYRYQTTKKAYQAFLKEYHLSKDDIAYKSKDVSLGKKGLIFYQAQIPALKISHKIDKLIIRPNRQYITIQMQGLSININETLSNYYGQSVIDAVQKYTPFDDALKEPFISLGLMGYNTIKGDVVLVFDPYEKPYTINAKISVPQLTETELSFTVLPPHAQSFNKSLIYAGHGTVAQVAVKMLDNGLFQKYADYLTSISAAKPAKQAADLLRHSDFIRRIEFKKPADLKTYYQKGNN